MQHAVYRKSTYDAANYNSIDYTNLKNIVGLAFLSLVHGSSEIA